MDYSLAAMTPQNWEAVRNIYRAGIATGDATFETDVPEWEAWDAAHVDTPRLVAREASQVIGWAALSRVSAREVYQGVAEVSLYVATDARGKGVGKFLLSRLINSSENAGFWTLQAGIFPDNRASILLHKRLGFREVGVRERIGQLKGVWRDVVLLERRSSDGHGLRREIQ